MHFHNIDFDDSYSRLAVTAAITIAGEINASPDKMLPVYTSRFREGIGTGKLARLLMTIFIKVKEHASASKNEEKRPATWAVDTHRFQALKRAYQFHKEEKKRAVTDESDY